MHFFRFTMLRSVIASAVVLALAVAAAITSNMSGVKSHYVVDLNTGIVGLSLGVVDIHLSDVDSALWGLLYLCGLGWMVFLVERFAHRIEERRVRAELRRGSDLGPSGIAISGEVQNNCRGWNPCDPAAWYYGSTRSVLLVAVIAGIATTAMLVVAPFAAPNAFRWVAKLGQVPALVCVGLLVTLFLLVVKDRLRQSLTFLGTYTLLFVLLHVLAHWRFHKNEENSYELPAGGGTDMVQASSVKVQKVVRKKYILNPYSSIIFSAPPPIDKVPLQLTEDTANQYKAGQGSGELGDGEGEGGGYLGGKGTGKIRLIRLKHSDAAWNKNMGIGGDYNLLIEFAARNPKFKGKTGESTESMEIVGLNTFPAKKSPPLVYIGGAHSFTVTDADKKALKRYLTERHGMILGDNLGGQGFHQQFIAVMNEVTGTTPVAIARDDRIHHLPYDLPQLPMVVAHGGTVPLGWKIDGRWAVYYHPGELSAAWRDDRSGIKKNIADLCYLLGMNILDYSHREYGRWLKSQQP